MKGFAGSRAILKLSEKLNLVKSSYKITNRYISLSCNDPEIGNSCMLHNAGLTPLPFISGVLFVQSYTLPIKNVH